MIASPLRGKQERGMKNTSGHLQPFYSPDSKIWHFSLTFRDRRERESGSAAGSWAFVSLLSQQAICGAWWCHTVVFLGCVSEGVDPGCRRGRRGGGGCACIGSTGKLLEMSVRKKTYMGVGSGLAEDGRS